MLMATTFRVEAMVRGYHVYQGVWAPTIGEELSCRKEHGNTQDPYAVAVLDGVNVVGHVPKKSHSICLLAQALAISRVHFPSSAAPHDRS